MNILNVQRWWLVLVWLMLAELSANGQDVVRYRSRSSKGEWSIQEAKGKIESESLAGLKLAGLTVPLGDIVEVEYEPPGSVRIDMREARQAEESRKTDDAIRKYRALAASPAATNSPALKRGFDYKIALLTSMKADTGPTELRAAITGLATWIREHPDGWQRPGATRLLARLNLDADPPNYDAARKAYEDLAATSGIDAKLKATCQLAVVDLYLTQRKPAEAKKALDAVSSSDPRVPPYRIACAADTTSAEATSKQLEDLISRSDDSIKPTLYNLLGDSLRLDPKKQKEARFAYLWVDEIYNHDPTETAKAQDKVADLCKKMGEEERAKQYRDKARGRG